MEISPTNPIPVGTIWRTLAQCNRKIREVWPSKRKPRTLRVSEVAGLGERRFVAVVQFEQQRFLIGGSAGTVTLLARLTDEGTTGDDA